MLLTSDASGIYLSHAGHVLQLTPSSVDVISGKVVTGALSQEIEAILGVIDLKTTRYVITANSVESVGKILDNEIYKVTSLSILPLSSNKAYDKDEHIYLDLLRFQLDLLPLYFLKTYDLTNLIQRNFSEGLKFSLEALDPRFFWNAHLCAPLLSAYKGNRVVGAFITPVICGYAHVTQETVEGSLVSFALVTRRSRFRAGTRYFRRGINDQGHVANFNETEQILIYKNTVQAYLQTRGSVPVRWAEVNNLRYKPQLLILDSDLVEPARRHFAEQKELYGTNYLVNLVNQKGYEQPVKEAYEKLVDELDDDKIKYTYFDFHHECRKMRWDRVSLLLTHLGALGLRKNDHFFGTVDKDGVSTIREQGHIVRTNCMDCLDRTNVVQLTLGRFFLQSQLEQLNIIKDGKKWSDNAKFEFEFMNMWADNADAVSSVYSGTGALKTDFTRTGKRTKKGAFNDFLNSITRYYQNNYRDGARQDLFDLFLGEYKPKKDDKTLPFADNRVYTYRYALNAFTFFLVLLFMSFLKGLVYGSSPKQKVLVLICIFGAVVSAVFMASNGMQIVDWPKLKPLDFLKKEPVYVKNGSKASYTGLRFVKNSDF